MNALDQHHVGVVADPLDLTVAWLPQATRYPLSQALEVDNGFVTPDPQRSTLARFTTEVTGG